MDALLTGHRRVEKTTPFAHSYLPDLGAVFLGKARPPFSGTDTLPMNVHRVAEAWLRVQKSRLVFGEGDRLACDAFLQTAVDSGYEIRLIYFEVADEQAKRRREIRAAENGLKLQNQGWVKGRGSKAERLAEKWGAIRVDANRGLEGVAMAVLRVVPELTCRPC